MKPLAAITTLLLAGCANQLDLREGDCSITMVEVDGSASTVMVGTVEADGWVLVTRGACDPALVDLYQKVIEG